MKFTRPFILLLSVIFIFYSAVPVAALSDAEKSFLSMYFTDEELVAVSATRSLKAISRIAENIEIVTARDIELMNAHTVADVLENIYGVQVRKVGGPGAVALPLIQSSESRHVAVFMDGIPLNLFIVNMADVAAVPVQIIEKIEVVKGPASSVWGSSLGGVVNIITKSGSDQKRSGGTLYASLGEQTFHDLRAEAYGKAGKTGYYFYAGRLGADGFRGLPDQSGISFNDYYLKLSHDLGKESQIVLTTFYNIGHRDEGNPPLDWIDTKRVENLFSSLTFNTALSNNSSLSLSVHALSRDWKYKGVVPSIDWKYTDFQTRDSSHGFNAKLTSKIQNHTIVGGMDYDNGVVHETDTVWGVDARARTSMSAIYINDTIDFGKLTVTPGIRLDHDNVISEFISPSLGLTYAVNDKTILKALVARGFNTPPALWQVDNVPYGFKGNPDLKPEKIWSYQLGVETGSLKYFWLKATAFQHDVSDAVVEEFITDPVFFYTEANKNKIRRQGIEAEIKTLPFYHFTFSAGTMAVSIKNLDHDETVRDYPIYMYKADLKYDDEKTLKALLSGRYVWWDSVRNGNYSGVIIDFNIMKRIYKHEDREAELFFTAHNILDVEQHQSVNYRYPDRWLEAGLRFKF